MNKRTVYLALSCCWLVSQLVNLPVSHAAAPDFETHIAPILIKRCVECHREPEPAGNLLLTSRVGLHRGGDSGPVIDWEHPRDSYLLTRIAEAEMPPPERGQTQRLPAEEAEQLAEWLAAGADWPENRHLDLYERTTDVRAGRDWWSLQPVQRPPVPAPVAGMSAENPIDVFIHRRLEAAGMTPAPPADKRTLLRRLYHDLIGMPPTEAQVVAFVEDRAPDAWERVVDALLASPAYGERWGRYWLDLARYADTCGYERDQEKLFAWKYRDWVLQAFNHDMPYDQFVTLQLAGDEVSERTEASVVATGFLRLGTWNDEPNDPADYQYDRLEDLVHTTASTFLALTVKCARCHTHKFDPILQEDYYRFAAAFWPGPIAARDSKWLGGPSAAELGLEKVLGWTDLSSSAADLHMLKNGDRHQPLQAVAAGGLSAIRELDRPFAPPSADARTTQRRRQLAAWITSERNPLMARVMVNRLWQHHFGQGIVRSPNNFGFLADPATHPELLDWLAAEFQSQGLSVKSIHRLILMSSTWQQAAWHPSAEEYANRDAGNRLWWRAERRRLDAEVLRDSLLSVSGELDRRFGGESFRPTLSPEALEGLSRKSAAWEASSATEQNRRSVYMFLKRGLLPPMMTVFDLGDLTQSCGARDVTTAPTQALALLNNQFVHARSEFLGQRIAVGVTSRPQQINAAWSQVLGRQPTRIEAAQAAEYLELQLLDFRQASEAVAETLPADWEAMAIASLCHVLMNSNEFMYVD